MKDDPASFNSLEGLPENYSEREDKIKTLLAKLVENKRVLVAGPPQSGKSALARLFRRHVKKNKDEIKTAFKLKDLKMFYISFADISITNFANDFKAATSN